MFAELFRERSTRLTQAQLASDISYDLDEEGEARAECAVRWLIEDGILRIVDGYIRLAL